MHGSSVYSGCPYGEQQQRFLTFIFVEINAASAGLDNIELTIIIMC